MDVALLATTGSPKLSAGAAHPDLVCQRAERACGLVLRWEPLLSLNSSVAHPMSVTSKIIVPLLRLRRREAFRGDAAIQACISMAGLIGEALARQHGETCWPEVLAAAERLREVEDEHRSTTRRPRARARAALLAPLSGITHGASEAARGHGSE